MDNHKTILFFGTPEDKSYVPRLKPLVGTATVFVLIQPLTVWTELKMYCQQKGITGIASTSLKLLQILSGEQDAKIDDYAGSLFVRDGIEIVFLHPLAQLVSLPYGTFIASRYLSKLVRASQWNTYPKFTFTLASKESSAEIEAIYEQFKSADAIAVDIETVKENLAITSIAYTAIHLSSGRVELNTIVLSLDDTFFLAWMRKFNTLPAPKIFQNGKYDCSYLLRYNVAPVNWLFDTANFMHAWYAELPKDLGRLSAFFYREGRFWKDMRHGDKLTRLEYNGRDTYSTAIVFCEWLLQSPQWAKTNFLQSFPVNYPCMLAEMTGIKRDMPRFLQARKEADAAIAAHSKSLDTMLGVANFNVNSPKQMKQLLTVLGCKDIAAESCDEKHLALAQFRHPLINRILDEVLEIRGLRKEVSTYLTIDDKAKEFKGRILYAINPHGTDTGRCSSNEHHFWCGLQIQNIPSGPSIKQTLVVDEGFRLYEVDLEQAESRDTGYISGDPVLINNVENSPDFHSSNASMFFGVPFEEIYDVHKEKVINKALRTLGKPVNHGANYNMGPNVLISSMGLKAIYKAQELLNLPKHWTPKQIAEHLLECFHKVYKTLKPVYYAGVIHEVKTTRKLTSKAVHDSPFHVAPWVRYCFSDPEKDKRALNAYVAHPPQSLNAMTLNKAFLRVFYEIAMHPVHKFNFRLFAQIHDSILFQVRIGHEYLAKQVQEIMQIPVTVKAFDGVTRTFVVPAAIKGGKDGKGAERWSETE